MKNKAVVGLMVTVTGFGGTFIEPGIPASAAIASQLRAVFATGLIHPASVVLRYDPLMKLQTENGRTLSNATPAAMEGVLELFKDMGITRVESKPLLAGTINVGKYHHVRERLTDAGLKPELFYEDEVKSSYTQLGEICKGLGFSLSTCCVCASHSIPGWNLDAGCLDHRQLTTVGKKLFGESWNRICAAKRPSRKGCLCSAYWDLSYVMGHKKCGAADAACLYCTACAKTFNSKIMKLVETEKADFFSGESKKYDLLVE
jgi:hypothetical protein